MSAKMVSEIFYINLYTHASFNLSVNDIFIENAPCMQLALKVTNSTTEGLLAIYANLR